MIYFDNSASTFIKPKQVQRMVNFAMNKYSANPGRSGHKASINTIYQIEKTRNDIAEFFEFKTPERVIFTQNCSGALNLALLGTAKENHHIIACENAHNSTLRPLEHLKKSKNITYSIAKQDKSKSGITLEEIKPLVNEKTYLIAINHISNVNGDIANIKEIGKFCRENNILFLVDGAQSAGHEEISMEDDCVDLLAIAPHKGLYSLCGIGVLLVGESVEIYPILFGGTGTHSLSLDQPDVFPEMLEVGTLSTPAILSCMGGIEFCNANFNDIREKLDDLTTYLHYEFSKLPLEIYTKSENGHGVFSFNVPNIHSNEVSGFLDEKYGICTRSGYHCAPKKHESLGTIDFGAVRVSFSFFNNISEVQKLVYATKNFLNLKEKEKKLQK